MLATVLMLAVAQNLEPTRAGIAALILAGPNPIRRLWAFLSGIYVAGLVVGILVLFVFHHALVARGNIDVGKVQIGIGAAAIVVAAVIAANVKMPRAMRKSPADDTVTFDSDDNHTEIAHGGFLAKLLTHSTRITNSSPAWVLFVLGLGFALPSVDFMALLLLIAASGAPAVGQIGALFLFLTLGNLATVVPLVSHRIAPATTLRKVEQFQAWLRSRSRRDVALIVAVFGLMIVATGVMNL